MQLGTCGFGTIVVLLASLSGGFCLDVDAAPPPGFTPVNIVGPTDARAGLAESAKALGLSAAEVSGLRSATGYVFCPGRDHGNPVIGSGTLVQSTSQIATAAHIFVDDKGQQRSPLAKCYFQNQAPVQVIGYIDSDGDHVRIGTTVALTDDVSDYATARIKEAITGAVPLPIAHGQLTVGEEVIEVAAWQRTATGKSDPTEPVVQACYIKTVQPASGSVPTNYSTDCDVSATASGGAVLVRQDGRLAIAAVVTSSGTHGLDYQPFDLQSGSYTTAIGLDGPFLDVINDVAGETH